MMSEPKGASSDPSMDDILASIRKIISEDSPETPAASPTHESDVLDLTQEVHDEPVHQPAPPALEVETVVTPKAGPQREPEQEELTPQGRFRNSVTEADDFEWRVPDAKLLTSRDERSRCGVTPL